jgi:hypothetical protein
MLGLPRPTEEDSIGFDALQICDLMKWSHGPKRVREDPPATRLALHTVQADKRGQGGSPGVRDGEGTNDTLPN